MSHTNKTTHYDLPQFIADDKPTWLQDVNDAYLKIDNGIYTAQNKSDDTASQLTVLEGRVEANEGNINTLTEYMATDKIAMQGLNTRMTDAEEDITELQKLPARITQLETDILITETKQALSGVKTTYPADIYIGVDDETVTSIKLSEFKHKVFNTSMVAWSVYSTSDFQLEVKKTLSGIGTMETIYLCNLDASLLPYLKTIGQGSLIFGAMYCNMGSKMLGRWDLAISYFGDQPYMMAVNGMFNITDTAVTDTNIGTTYPVGTKWKAIIHGQTPYLIGIGL